MKIKLFYHKKQILFHYYCTIN